MELLKIISYLSTCSSSLIIFRRSQIFRILPGCLKYKKEKKEKHVYFLILPGWSNWKLVSYLSTSSSSSIRGKYIWLSFVVLKSSTSCLDAKSNQKKNNTSSQPLLVAHPAWMELFKTISYLAASSSSLNIFRRSQIFRILPGCLK